MKIIYPKFFPLGCIYHHSPDTSFPGMVKLWRERGYCDSEQSDSPFFWVGRVGHILLYSWDTLEHLHPDQMYSAGLFANPEPPINGRYNRNWIYWPRHSFVTEQHYKYKPMSYQDRRFNCSFIGGYENLTQRGYRCINYWKPALDFLDFGIRGGNYSWQQYTRVLRNSRYGLCLRGVGTKCHREIECMAQGCVPILTHGCSMDYHDPLVVGQHCLYARGVEDVVELVHGTTRKQWDEMSWQARDWYWRNASPRGGFETTKRIVELL